MTIEHSPIAMALVSPQGELMVANLALCDLLDHDPSDRAAMHFLSITHPDDVDLDHQLAHDMLAGRANSYRVKKRYIRSDGSIVVGDLSVTLLRDEQGRPVHFIFQIVDLSERLAFASRLEAAEDQMDAERRRTEAIYGTVEAGLLFLDANGSYHSFNARHQELMELGFPEGHLGRAGQVGDVFLADLSRRATSEELPTTRAAAGEEFQNEVFWVGADPETRRALSVSARSVRDRLGGFSGAALVYHDVTDMTRAVNVRDDFVASVSHELRTPLTSVLAYLELLDGSEGLNEEVHGRIAAARRNALRLTHLVADLLYTASATSGAPLIGPFKVDLARVISLSVDAAGLASDKAGVRLELDLPESLTMVVDGLRLSQVIDNLIANAIAYTPDGGVVRISLSEREDLVEIEVADTGEGVDQEDLDEIFARFFRGQNARRRQMPGAGLGLHIVRTIVEAHDGQVSMDSAVGEGTTVRVLLPKLGPSSA